MKFGGHHSTQYRRYFSVLSVDGPLYRVVTKMKCLQSWAGPNIFPLNPQLPHGWDPNNQCQTFLTSTPLFLDSCQRTYPFLLYGWYSEVEWPPSGPSSNGTLHLATVPLTDWPPYSEPTQTHISTHVLPCRYLALRRPEALMDSQSWHSLGWPISPLTKP